MSIRYRSEHRSTELGLQACFFDGYIPLFEPRFRWALNPAGARFFGVLARGVCDIPRCVAVHKHHLIPVNFIAKVFPFNLHSGAVYRCFDAQASTEVCLCTSYGQ